MQIKDAIRFYRKRAGITQLELAEKLGVNRSTIARYENGSNNPSPMMIDRISEIVGIDLLESIEYFKDDTEPDDIREPYELALETFIEYIANECGYNIAVTNDSCRLNMDEADSTTLFLDCNKLMNDGAFIVAKIQINEDRSNDDDVVGIPNEQLINIWDYVVKHASIDFMSLIEKYRNGKQD